MNYDWEHLLNTYQTSVKTSFTVLEIGASTLDRTQQLAVSCKNVIGIELFANRIPKNKNPKIKYIIADWQNLSKVLKANSIDLAISSHVIEHVPDDKLALSELYKVLKPGGIAIFNTPNRLRLARSIIEIFTGPRKFPWWEHLREYSYQDIKKLCLSSPFAKYTITPVVFGLHAHPWYFFSIFVPPFLKKYANYWEIILNK